MNEGDALARKFWCAIIAGLVVFLLVAGSLAYSTNPQPSERAEQPQSQQSTAQNAGNTGSKNPENPVLFEVKITDLALILFTYCLVVVGWATMRSGELSAVRNERAYIFVGGGIETKVMQDQNGALHNFMWCKNSGRSFAILTEYYFGWSDKKPSGKPKYPPARDGLNVFTDTIDLVCNPGEPKELNASALNINVTPYCVGRILYKDIYGKERESRFAGLMKDGKIHPAGGKEWNSWT